MPAARAKTDDSRPQADARERILSAGRRHFATVGFEGASTRQIATEAGVAQSLLLYHFGSKEALWRAVIDQMFKDLNLRVATAARQARGSSIQDRLLAVIRVFIQICAEDADIHRIMTIEGRQPSDRLRWLVETHLKENHRQACQLILEGQANGVVRTGNPTLLYYSFIAIAGTAFSLAPEIELVSDGQAQLNVQAIEDMICGLVFVTSKA